MTADRSEVHYSDPLSGAHPPTVGLFYSLPRYYGNTWVDCLPGRLPRWAGLTGVFLVFCVSCKLLQAPAMCRKGFLAWRKGGQSARAHQTTTLA